MIIIYIILRKHVHAIQRTFSDVKNENFAGKKILLKTLIVGTR